MSYPVVANQGVDAALLGARPCGVVEGGGAGLPVAVMEVEGRTPVDFAVCDRVLVVFPERFQFVPDDLGMRPRQRSSTASSVPVIGTELIAPSRDGSRLGCDSSGLEL